MITPEEIKFIYDNWKVNQYLSHLFWGQSHERAIPEYYLAVKRGAIFEKQNSYMCLINLNFSYVEKVSVVYSYENALQLFSREITQDWMNFIQKYSLEEYNKTLYSFKNTIKKHILHTLEHNLNNFTSIQLEEDRIYTL